MDADEENLESSFSRSVRILQATLQKNQEHNSKEWAPVSLWLCNSVWKEGTHFVNPQKQG